MVAEHHHHGVAVAVMLDDGGEHIVVVAGGAGIVQDDLAALVVDVWSGGVGHLGRGPHLPLGGVGIAGRELGVLPHQVENHEVTRRRGATGVVVLDEVSVKLVAHGIDLVIDRLDDARIEQIHVERGGEQLGGHEVALVVPHIDLPAGTMHDGGPHGALLPALAVAQAVEAEEVLERDTGEVIGRDSVGEHGQQAAVTLGTHQRRRVQGVAVQAGVPLVVALADDKDEIHRIDGTRCLALGSLTHGEVDGGGRLLLLDAQGHD